MKYIGLLLNSHEDDILEATLTANLEHLDCFYVLDGTVPNTDSRRICESFGKCAGYQTDADLPRPPYPVKPVCGYRQAILEAAVADHGFDNWFVVLHGDEVWTFNPRDLPGQHPGVDGFTFQLPFYFPRDGEPWDDEVGPLEQLRWRLGPGYPEFRMFKGGPGVAYDPAQTYNAAPRGLTNTALVPLEIRHYLYRSPAVQQARYERHLVTGFDPANYAHIGEGRVYWDDAMIRKYRAHPFFKVLSGE